MLNRDDLRVGMRVMFGRPDAERTSGVIMKLMTTRARVVSLEPRQGKEAGAEWNVPYALLSPVRPDPIAAFTIWGVIAEAK